MNEPPVATSARRPPPVATEPTAAADGCSGLIRAGRLAGGAIVAAWVVSISYHVVLFTIMYLVPYLSSMVKPMASGAELSAAPIGDPDAPLVALTPPSSAATVVQPPDAAPSLAIVPNRAMATVGLWPSLNGGGSPGSGVGGAPGSIGGMRPGGFPALPGVGVGTGGGGDLDRYGMGGLGGGGAPSFFGLGGEARGTRNIVYVVDRSGSMLTTLEGVKKELVESVGKLRRTQKFHVVFFNSGAPLENPPRRLVSAIQAHKQEFFNFLGQIAAGGSTDPRPAMRRAFAVEPDLIYFLTDGEFDEGLIELLDVLNRGRRVRIYTIAYVSQAGAPLLERIAREHNGQYRFVSEEEIF